MLKFDFDFTLPERGPVHAAGALASGARVAISGPSGCGKSTFLRALCDLGPRTGRVTWNDRPIDTDALCDGLVGFCFQSAPLFSHLSVLANILVPLQTLRPFAMLSDDVREQRASQILDRAGLLGIRDRAPGTLSGGERKRVSLLRSLVFEPPLLVLDEPFSDLDPVNRELFKKWIMDRLGGHRGIVLLVSHQASDFVGFATHSFRWPDQGDRLEFGKLEVS